jgi:hypothetical protein
MTPMRALTLEERAGRMRTELAALEIRERNERRVENAEKKFAALQSFAASAAQQMVAKEVAENPPPAEPEPGRYETNMKNLRGH